VLNVPGHRTSFKSFPLNLILHAPRACLGLRLNTFLTIFISN
jgi:hypothetical protein